MKKVRSHFCRLLFLALSPLSLQAVETPPSAEIFSPNWILNLPMQFEPNAGHANPQIQFISRGPGYAVGLTREGAIFSLQATEPSTHSKSNSKAGLRRKSKASPRELRMTLLGANPHPQITGVEEASGTINYLIGNHAENWRTGIRPFAQVRYSEVYPGVDLIFYGNQKQLEYDFVVQPGANPDRIGLAFHGAERLELDAEGNLLAHLIERQVKWRKPFAYQDTAQGRQEIPAAFVLHGQHQQVRFQLGAYDPGKPLVIDPVLVYSTYLGGNGDDYLMGITADTNGNVYVIGDTSSLNFPVGPAYDSTPNGSNDVFVTKLNATGTARIFSTYLGGNGDDLAGAIAVDSAGNVYVTGQTESSNFPTRNAYQNSKSAYSDFFLTKLGPLGTNVLYSTYYGGNQDDGGTAIAVENNGRAYVAGYTYSGRNFPTKNPFQSKAGGYPNDFTQDAVVAKFNTGASGSSSLVYGSWLGGSTDEIATGIAVDASGNAYVAGIVADYYTLFPDPPTSDFPLLNPYQNKFNRGSTNFLSGLTDGFVTKINANGSAMIFSTFLGGSDEDSCWGLALDSSNRVFVVGETGSANFPVLNAAQSVIGGGTTEFSPEDAFLTVFHNSGTNLVYSTYLGGSDYESGFGFFSFDIAVDKFGLAYITGKTTSFDFPLTPGADQTNATGTGNAFIAKINPNVPGPSSLIYSTLFGGNNDNYGMAIAVDPSGNFYVGGMTSSTDFPVTGGVVGPTNNGGFYDTYVAKFSSPTDLSVSMVASVEPVIVGSNVTYTLQVFNNGRTTFTGITNSVTLSPNVQLIAASAGWITNGQTLTRTIGTLTNNASSTATITVFPLSPGPLTNIALVTANETEPNLSNNISIVASTSRGVADLALANSGSPNPVLVSSNVIYTLSVTNKGSWPATSVVVTSTQPASVKFVSATPTQGTWDIDANFLTWNIGTLPAGSSATILLTAAALTAGTSINDAGVFAFELDPVTTNNIAKSTVTINPLAELQLGGSVSTNSLFVLSNLTYTLRITNRGPSTATSTLLTNPLPPGMAFVSASTTHGTVIHANGLVTSALGNLASNAVATLTITAKALNAGIKTNSASISSAVADPVLANNLFSLIATAVPLAELSVAQTAVPNPALAFSNFTLTLLVTNRGPSPATPVVTDPLPPAFTLLSAESAQGSCLFSNGTVVCQLSSLASNAVATITLVARANLDGIFTNTVTVTAPELDLNPTNNTHTTVLVINENPSAPLLKITFAQNYPVLSWPTNSLNFTLISSTNLVAGPWMTVTNPPVIISNRFVLTNEPTELNMFYRLIR